MPLLLLLHALLLQPWRAVLLLLLLLYAGIILLPCTLRCLVGGTSTRCSIFSLWLTLGQVGERTGGRGATGVGKIPWKPRQHGWHRANPRANRDESLFTR
jgi:hypothetical protein